jgi:hypothetical protein
MIKFTSTYWKNLGDEVRDLFYKHVVKDGKDYKGDPFKAYNDYYKWRKTSGTVFKQIGKRPRKATGGRQSSTSGTPDLRLTGDMMSEYEVTKYNKKMVQIGWLSSTDKVQYNADNGRRIHGTNSLPFPPEIMKHIEEDISMHLFKQADKYMKSKVEIKMDI